MTDKYTDIMIRIFGSFWDLYAECHDGIDCCDWDIYPYRCLLLISRKVVKGFSSIGIFPRMRMDGISLAEGEEECQAAGCAEINRLETSRAGEIGRTTDASF